MHKKLQTEICKSMVGKYFKKSAKKGNKSTATPLWKGPANEQIPSAYAFLMNHMPSPAAIVCDKVNGRWQIAYPGLQRRSYAWTKRGLMQYLRLALIYMWQSHYEATLESPSWDMEAMIRHVGVGAA